MNLVVLGTQWGDEGKGKIVDLLARDFDAVVRFQGGNNAGHTVKLGDRTYKFHLVPSGILHPGKMCVLGNGMVIDPVVLLEEFGFLTKNGHSLDNLYISDRAHVIMPYHKRLDEFSEKGPAAVGTTGRGIGPCYSDKVARLGIRFADLLNHAVFEKRLHQILPVKQRLLEYLGDKDRLSAAELLKTYGEYGEKLRRHVADTALLLNDWMKEGKSLLLEGAQGTFLGIDHGTYPYVTSSSTIAGNACCGAGISPRKIDKIIGVVKAYTTRVGMGWFPTEIPDATGELLRRQGQEYGTTTGRPRRCGWLDLALLRRAVMLNGIDEIALTKLDVLGNISPIKIGVGYLYKNSRLPSLPADLEVLEHIEPVYEEISGWTEDISSCRSFTELPRSCQKYVQHIEEWLQIPVKLISVGPERNQTLVR